MLEAIDGFFNGLRHMVIGLWFLICLALLPIIVYGVTIRLAAAIDLSGGGSPSAGIPLPSPKPSHQRKSEPLWSTAKASVAGGISQLDSTAGATGRSLASSLHSGAGAVGQYAADSLVYGLQLPFHGLRFMADSALVSGAIRPADHAPAPVIVPLATAVSVPTAPAAPATPPTPETVWPLRGRITTEFGAPDWPYEAWHTGLDIADGRPAGATPVKAFRAGRVTAVIRGYTGLGNHVVVDHGSGLTSVYGHLASIAVQDGQAVDTSTTLGYEGSTGASTGTHLHFETRLYGQAINPHRYLPE